MAPDVCLVIISIISIQNYLLSNSFERKWAMLSNDNGEKGRRFFDRAAEIHRPTLHANHKKKHSVPRLANPGDSPNLNSQPHDPRLGFSAWFCHSRHAGSSAFPPYCSRCKMKVKSRSVCQNCRQRKYSCDGKRPSCSQCIATKRDCPGYEAVTFLPPKTSGQQIISSGPLESPISREASLSLSGSSTGCLILNLSAFRWSTDEEFFALVTEYFTPYFNGQEQYGRPKKHFSTLCSPWLETVPLLLDTSRSTTLLSVSLRTLGYSIIAKGNRDRRRSQWDLCRAESYTKAVHSLSNKIAEDDGGCNESAAAIMCLCLAEWLVPTSREGWIAHIRGIGRMMEMCGPESFTGPIAHQLFIGFRPLVILEACISRQDTFLSSVEWQTIPFAFHEPSPLQTLLSHGSILPSVLRRVQTTDSLPLNERGPLCEGVIAELINTLQELDNENVNHYDGGNACSRAAETRKRAASHKEGGSSASRFTRFGRPESWSVGIDLLLVTRLMGEGTTKALGAGLRAVGRFMAVEWLVVRVKYRAVYQTLNRNRVHLRAIAECRA
ncbi:Zn(II)2Cys6 transcription factor domain-containing protein [Aspergillus tubingensis]|uniref:Zn(II)2Cys6 transcription factor domain-containing protein n=1 Tax=Aspergillus tubingensis TaxID=5068 RepID=UPI001578F565|nr:quinone oxidoreductase [Aspergillus tubingensis]GFN17056.1 quinone oxidoreductase [Aspergillus tubingensis]